MARSKISRFRRRGGTAVATVCIALAMPGSAFAYHIVQYFGTATIPWNVVRYSAFNYMQMNRVYRPTPKTFALYYNTNQGNQYEENRYSNPFVHDNAGGYTNANCVDVDPFSHSGTPNTTCQYQVLHVMRPDGGETHEDH